MPMAGRRAATNDVRTEIFFVNLCFFVVKAAAILSHTQQTLNNPHLPHSEPEDTKVLGIFLTPFRMVSVMSVPFFGAICVIVVSKPLFLPMPHKPLAINQQIICNEIKGKTHHHQKAQTP